MTAAIVVGVDPAAHDLVLEARARHVLDAELAMAAGEPGSELLAPLAVVVLGGLVTSTLLNLVVVPAGYSLIFGCSKVKHSEGARLEQSLLRAPVSDTLS